MVCTLQNIKVTVDYSSELAGMLADTSKATISLGQTSQEFLKTETRAAYFKSLDIENTLDFNFDGVFADTDIPAQFSKQITGVKAGQWRKISVVINYADKGTLLFQVTVDNNIIQDNSFVVDGTDNLLEELLEDPSAPALAWPGHDMSKPFTLTDAMFDDNGNCIEPFVFDLASPNGIESLRVNIASTSSQFMASMAAIQLPETFDLLHARRVVAGRHHTQRIRLPCRRRTQGPAGQELQHRRADQGALRIRRHAHLLVRHDRRQRRLDRSRAHARRGQKRRSGGSCNRLEGLTISTSSTKCRKT